MAKATSEKLIRFKAFITGNLHAGFWTFGGFIYLTLTGAVTINLETPFWQKLAAFAPLASFL